jgi:formamidopyrimidine-DNA glycosylase
MPELPEVETIRNHLRLGKEGQPSLLGRLIKYVEVDWARSIAFPTPDEFQEQIAGQIVLEIDRRGKYLIFHLSDSELLVHLRMSGDLSLYQQQPLISPYDRIIFHLEEGLQLVFNDTRKFGRVWLVNDATQIIGELGPEPFDTSLSQELFYQRLHASKRQLKPLLLDQTFIAGLGNIYTDEALHLAHLHPLKRSNQLSPEQSFRLLESIRQVLEAGIRSHGASIDWVYRGGDFQNYFRAYRRTGLPCPECGASIERIVVGQRSTHFCPSCQSN